MSATSLRSSGRAPLPEGVHRIGGTADYTVSVWRNVMILFLDGGLDEPFFTTALACHNAALRFEPSGYGVVVLVGHNVRIPNAEMRALAAEHRQKTQHMLRAQSVLIGGEGFFASTMRAVMTGILAVAQSRVPMKMVSGELEAASFVVERACGPGANVAELQAALVSLRAPAA